MWFSYCFHYGELNLHGHPWRLYAQSCVQLYLTLCDPLDCSPSGFSVHGMLQTRILEWAAIFFSRASYRPRDRTQVSCTAGRFFTNWATMCLRVWMTSIRCKKMNVISNRLGLFGLPRWHSGKESTCQGRRHKRYCFTPCVRKIPRGRKWQPTPVFLPEKSHRQRSLVGYYSLCAHKESDMTEHTPMPVVTTWRFHGQRPGFDPWAGN